MSPNIHHYTVSSPNLQGKKLEFCRNSLAQRNVLRSVTVLSQFVGILQDKPYCIIQPANPKGDIGGGNLPQNLFGPADICLPRVADMTRWSVVACDQYTSEPAYWNEVERTVGDAPSTLRLVLPELYLEQPEVENRISAIGAAMRRYVDDGILEVHPNCCIYLERTLADGRVRRGLIGAVDLEAYDFSVGSVSPLRATEGTVLSRIPPRLAVRKAALLELPHVMVLLDDPDKTVIEPLSARTGALEQAYDFDLM